MLGRVSKTFASRDSVGAGRGVVRPNRLRQLNGALYCSLQETMLKWTYVGYARLNEFSSPEILNPPQRMTKFRVSLYPKFLFTLYSLSRFLTLSPHFQDLFLSCLLHFLAIPFSLEENQPWIILPPPSRYLLQFDICDSKNMEKCKLRIVISIISRS